MGKGSDNYPHGRGFTWLIFVLFAAALAVVVSVAVVSHNQRQHTGYESAPEAAGSTMMPKTTEALPAPTPSSAATAEPTALPSSEALDSFSPDDSSAPVVTQSPFVKTGVYVDGVQCAVLSSRQAAESLMSSVNYYFETLDIIPPGAVTVLLNEVELKAADADADTMDYDTAFAYLTGSTTPLSYRSDVTFYQDNVIDHTVEIEYSDTLPSGYRVVKVYGSDGVNRIIYSSTYINGLRRELIEKERATVYPAIDGLVVVGTAAVNANGNPPMHYGEPAPLPEGLDMYVPASGIVFGFFGMNDNGFHNGIDIACNAGADVFAAQSGTVTAVMERGSYGLMVDIDHGSGVITRYARLGSVSVKPGDTVAAGDRIGTIAAALSMPHLHFELRCDNLAYNPLNSFVDLEKLDLTYAIEG